MSKGGCGTTNGLVRQTLRQLLDREAAKSQARARAENGQIHATEEKIADYLKTKIPAARDLTLSDFVQTAGGWSHEIFIFYANWTEGGRAMRQGLCLRRGRCRRPARC